MKVHLIPTSTLKAWAFGLLALSIVTFVVAVFNLVVAGWRINRAQPEEGTAAYVAGSQIIRGGVAGVFVGASSMLVSSIVLDALYHNSFQLTYGWFAYSFALGIYTPTLMRLLVCVAEFRDRHLLSEITGV